MTYNEFWHESHERVIAYRLAEYRRIESRNQEMWLQGLYIYNAFGVVLGNAFMKKGSTPQKYLEKPLNILPKTGKEVMEEQKREREKAINALTQWATNWNTVHRQGD